MPRLPLQATDYCELRVRDVEHYVVHVELEAMWNLDAIGLARDAPCPSCSGVAENLNSKPIGMGVRWDRARDGFAGTRAQFVLVDLVDGRYFVGIENAPRAHNVWPLRTPRSRKRYTLLALAYTNIGGIHIRL